MAGRGGQIATRDRVRSRGRGRRGRNANAAGDGSTATSSDDEDDEGGPDDEEIVRSSKENGDGDDGDDDDDDDETISSAAVAANRPLYARKGRHLCNMGRERFVAEAPPFLGDILWEHLEMMQKGERFMNLNSPRTRYHIYGDGDEGYSGDRSLTSTF